MHKYKTALPQDFLNNGKAISDPLEIADQFNEYFINVGLSLTKKFNRSSANAMNHLRGTYVNNSMFLNEMTINEVAKEITYNTKKGFGIDRLSLKVLQCIANYICESLTHIVNLSFSTGKIPHELKVSLVKPVYRANDNKQLTNYRPIPVLTCFSKILEKLMYKRLLDYIEENSILYGHQYGFRSKHSTSFCNHETHRKN